MNLEVTRIFTPSLAWSLKISERNLDRQPSDAWHSSSASTTIKISEYMATTDRRAFESSSNVGHKGLSDSSVEMAFPGSAALTGLQVGVIDSPFVPPSEVPIDVSNTSVRFPLDSCSQVIDRDCSEDCFPCSRNPWTEQCLLGDTKPCPVLLGI